MNTKVIRELRKGKDRINVSAWRTIYTIQDNLKDNQYVFYWLVDGNYCVYIDKKNWITQRMTEKEFNKLDTAKISATI